MTFDTLNLIEPLLRSMRTVGYQTPTQIQRLAIPHVLARRDLIGCAQTGTGKTAAFVLPILQQLAAIRSAAPEGQRHGPDGHGRNVRGSNIQGRDVHGRDLHSRDSQGRDSQRRDIQESGIQVLVLAPTRELAAQIGQSFHTYGQFLPSRCAIVFGGVGQGEQVRALRQGPQILVATPGRLLDLMDQGFIKLHALRTFVLDEADRMLDMGFIHDVRKIVSRIPAHRQTLMFSATMEPEVCRLAQHILRDPVRVAATPSATTADRIEQSVYFAPTAGKRALLAELLRSKSVTRALVFTRTRHGANKVVKHLMQDSIGAIAIHGDKSQSAREHALAAFKSGRTRVLVATDIAARGLDVDDISHVINFDIPEVPETYVHRIGRTARAGAAGVSVSLCADSERAYLRQIERLTRTRIPVAGSAWGSAAGPGSGAGAGVGAAADDASRTPAQPRGAVDPAARRTSVASPGRQSRSHGTFRARRPGAPARAPGRRWGRSAPRRRQ